MKNLILEDFSKLLFKVNSLWVQVPESAFSKFEVLKKIKAGNHYLVAQFQNQLKPGIKSHNSLIKSNYNWINQIVISKSLLIKMVETIRMFPESAPSYMSFYITQALINHDPVRRAFIPEQFPDTAELGRLEALLNQIDDQFKDIQRINLISQDDLKEIIKSFQKTIQYYGNLEQILIRFIEKQQIL